MSLFTAVIDEVKTRIDLPLSDYHIGSDDEALHPYLVEHIYEQLYRRAIGLSMSTSDPSGFEITAAFRVFLP